MGWGTVGVAEGMSVGLHSLFPVDSIQVPGAWAPSEPWAQPAGGVCVIPAAPAFPCCSWGVGVYGANFIIPTTVESLCEGGTTHYLHELTKYSSNPERESSPISRGGN